MTILKKGKNSKKKDLNFSDNFQPEEIVAKQRKKITNKKALIYKKKEIIHELNKSENSNENIKKEIIIRYKLDKNKNKIRLFVKKININSK